jgi:hypothetical protein
VLLNVLACIPASGQTPIETVLATLNRLSIELPTNVIVNEPVRSPLEALRREPCDQKAIEELGAAAEKVGRRREAATVHISFSATFPGHYAPFLHAPLLRTAVNILLTLSDYARAASIAFDRARAVQRQRLLFADGHQRSRRLVQAGHR